MNKTLDYLLLELDIALEKLIEIYNIEEDDMEEVDGIINKMILINEEIKND